MACGTAAIRVTLRALEDDRVLYNGRIEHRAHMYRRQ